MHSNDFATQESLKIIFHPQRNLISNGVSPNISLNETQKVEILSMFNPFINHSSESWRAQIKNTLVGTVLLPVRLICICVLLSILAAICRAWEFFVMKKGNTSCEYTKQPKWLRTLISYGARLLLFCFGYHWIQTVSHPARQDLVPIVISNHTTFIDFIFFMYAVPNCFYIELDLVNHPRMISMILRSLLCVVKEVPGSEVERKHRLNPYLNGRENQSENVQFVIFPQYVMTNQRALVTFRTEAFATGASIQPVLLRYPFHFFDPAVVGHMSLMKSVFLHLCQLQNYLHVHYLPPYYPDLLEHSKPELLAYNVRNQLATCLLPDTYIFTTWHTFEDIQLQLEAIEFLDARHREENPLQMCDEAVSTGTGCPTTLAEHLKEGKQTNASITKSFFKFLLQMNADPLLRRVAEHEKALHSVFILLDNPHKGYEAYYDFFVGRALENMARKIQTSHDEEGKVHFDFFFELMDADKDGFLKREELAYSLSLVMYRSKEEDQFCRPGITDSINKNFQELVKCATKTVSEVVKDIMDECDPTETGRVHHESLYSWFQNHSKIIDLFCRKRYLLSEMKYT